MLSNSRKNDTSILMDSNNLSLTTLPISSVKNEILDNTSLDLTQKIFYGLAVKPPKLLGPDITITYRFVLLFIIICKLLNISSFWRVFREFQSKFKTSFSKNLNNINLTII